MNGTDDVKAAIAALVATDDETAHAIVRIVLIAHLRHLKTWPSGTPRDLAADLAISEYGAAVHVQQVLDAIRSGAEYPIQSGGCEWNPDEKRPATADDKHYQTAAAVFIVGADGQWRLCSSCAALPHFGRYRTRRIIPRSSKES